MNLQNSSPEHNGYNALQNSLLQAVKDISLFAFHARELSIKDKKIDDFVFSALHASASGEPTDRAVLEELFNKSAEIHKRAKTLYSWSLAPFLFDHKDGAQQNHRQEEEMQATVNLRIPKDITQFQPKSPLKTRKDLEKDCLLQLCKLLKTTELIRKDHSNIEHVHAFFYESIVRLFGSISNEDLELLVNEIDRKNNVFKTIHETEN